VLTEPQHMPFHTILSEMSTLGDHMRHTCEFEHAFMVDILVFGHFTSS
jgi:hypothetical protein